MTALMAQDRTARLAASPHLFDNGFLDFFSRVHPSIPAVIFIPAVVRRSGWDDRGGSEPVRSIGLIGGVVIWTLTEYWLHRLVFHWEPDNDSAGACTSSSTASTTTIRMTGCAW